MSFDLLSHPMSGLAVAASTAPDAGPSIPPTLVVAVALVIAVAASLLARYIRFLPLVTAYIVAGILIGPSALGLLHSNTLTSLLPLRDIALAVVLFTIGTRCELDVFRRMWRWLLVWGAWDVGAVLVILGLPMLGLTMDLEEAILLTLIALEIAPAATFLVLRETASSGPMTRLIINAVVINNIFVISLFSLVYPLLQLSFHGAEWTVLLHGPAVILGSVALGTVIGLAVSVAEQKYETDSERLLLLLGGILLTLGLSRLLGFQPFLISSLVAGIVLGNSSGKTEHVRNLIQRIDTPFYVIFFVLAGASLHLDYLFEAKYALLGIAYIALRATGRLVGGWVGARKRPFEPRLIRWFPVSLLSHSAIAIALVGILTADNPAGSPHHEKFQALQAVVLAAVAIYELGAPILLTVSLNFAGEVSVAHIMHRGRGIADVGAWKQTLHRLGDALGFIHPAVPTGLAQAGLEQLIIRDVHGIHMDQGYNKVLGFVSHSSFDCFPVVDEDGYYAGYISYFQLQDFAWDPSIGDLVIAGDMMITGHEINLDVDKPDEMAEKFARNNTTYLPVVRPDKEQAERLVLVGMIEQKTLMRHLLSRSAAEQARKKEETPAEPEAEKRASEAPTDSQDNSDDQAQDTGRDN